MLMLARTKLAEVHAPAAPLRVTARARRAALAVLDGPPRRFLIALTIVVSLVTLKSFAESLRFGFTDFDGLADYAYAGHPLSEQILARLTGGAAGTGANFWRPSAMLEYWLLRRAFGGGAFGWHLWGLALHAAASVLLAVFVLRTRAFERGREDRGTRMIALAAAVIFAAHPLAEEIVPAIARFIDVLLAVGCFASLAAFVRFQEHRRAGRLGAGAYVACVAWFALALGAKELALAIVPALAVWIVAFRGELSWRSRLREIAIALAPFALLAFAYFKARSHVIGQLGGYYPMKALLGKADLMWIFDRSLVEPFFSAYSAELAPIGGFPAVSLTTLGWIGVVMLARRSAYSKLVAVCAAIWIAAMLLLSIGGVGPFCRRMIYMPTIFFAVLPAVAIVEAWQKKSVLARVLATGYVASLAYGSPLVVPYRDWAEVDAIDQARMHVYASLEPGERAVFVDWVMAVHHDKRRWRSWTQQTLTHTNLAYGTAQWAKDTGHDASKVWLASKAQPTDPIDARYRPLVTRRDRGIFVSYPTANIARDIPKKSEVPGLSVHAKGSGIVCELEGDAPPQPTAFFVWNPTSPEQFERYTVE